VTASLHKRLKQLEQTRAAELNAARQGAQEEDGRCFVEGLKELLRVNGFQPGPDESWASAHARFLGISYQELQHQLMERACGQ
jgi:hypothetical protein